ncbi:MAG: hypothetical protein RLZZ102_49 [Pseudomonadota bacterium]|jgi:hypothetical protein
MKVNVGNIDRVLRISSGVVIVTLTALGMVSPWGWLAIGLIVSGVLRNCTLYSLLGVNTCKR